MNKCTTGFEPRTPGRKANTITTELKRILPNAVVRYCISIRKQPCLKEWSPVTKAITKGDEYPEEPLIKKLFFVIEYQPGVTGTRLKTCTDKYIKGPELLEKKICIQPRPKYNMQIFAC